MEYEYMTVRKDKECEKKYLRSLSARVCSRRTMYAMSMVVEAAI